ncbi:hypothetical protein RFI_00534 [Reticulomyxa filosa]|uniref:Uncharacterized protein n=1 Tax=Reticulomyxa filosa TaxID=46433 RepID=X6PEJ5_RETFI|nr:hypothetical protein RFI_00534 [Reticulomyxa filosa]|eukprot:ETO36528.1 hypothetical protein RFI_00534 [Reticulomyxa filosa]
MTFQNTLPSPLKDCVAILSEDNTCVHIIGGENDKECMSTHMKTEVCEWLSEKGIELKVEKENEEEESEEEEKDSDNKIVKKRM